MGAHEDLAREHTVQRSSERSFGFVIAASFTIIAMTPLLKHGTVRWWALAVAAPFLLLAIFAPAVLRPLNKLWFALGMLLHRVVSPVVLAATFYLLFTPYGDPPPDLPARSLAPTT